MVAFTGYEKLALSCNEQVCLFSSLFPFFELFSFFLSFPRIAFGIVSFAIERWVDDFLKGRLRFPFFSPVTRSIVRFIRNEETQLFQERDRRHFPLLFLADCSSL